MSRFISACVVGLFTTTARSGIPSTHSDDSDYFPFAQDIQRQLVNLADAKISIARIYESAYGEEFEDVYKVVGPVLTHHCPLLESFIDQLVCFGSPLSADEGLLEYIQSPACDRQIVHRKFKLATAEISSKITQIRDSGASRLAELMQEIKILEALQEEVRVPYEALEAKLQAHTKATENVIALMEKWQRLSPRSSFKPLANFEVRRDVVTGMFEAMYRSDQFPTSVLTRYLRSIVGYDYKSRPSLYRELCLPGYNFYVVHAHNDMTYTASLMRGELNSREKRIKEEAREMAQIERALEY